MTHYFKYIIHNLSPIRSENIPSKPPRLSLGGNKTPRKMPANHVPLKSMVTPTPKTHITVKLDKTQLSHIKS